MQRPEITRNFHLESSIAHLVKFGKITGIMDDGGAKVKSRYGDYCQVVSKSYMEMDICKGILYMWKLHKGHGKLITTQCAWDR